MAMDEGNRISDFRAPPWPEDFPVHLGRLEERPREWRSGAAPTADEVWAMAHWACRVPGGLSVMLTGCPHSLTVRE